MEAFIIAWLRERGATEPSKFIQQMFEEPAPLCFHGNPLNQTSWCYPCYPHEES